MSETFTPAVERAAELLIHEAETTGLIRDDVRNGLGAALDVEEMALEMLKHQRIAPYSERQCMCGVTVSSKETGAEHVASALRASILGADS